MDPSLKHCIAKLENIQDWRYTALFQKPQVKYLWKTHWKWWPSPLRSIPVIPSNSISSSLESSLRMHIVQLQHSERVDPPLGPPSVQWYANLHRDIYQQVYHAVESSNTIDNVKAKPRTRRVSHLTNSASFLLANSSRMTTSSQTSIFKSSLSFTLSFISVVVCRSSSRCWLENSWPLKLNHLIWSTMLRPTSRIRGAFPLTSSVWSSLESGWRMDTPFQTTTSRRSLPFTLVCIV